MRKTLNEEKNIVKRCIKKYKKCLSKVEKVCKQKRQGTYFI